MVDIKIRNLELAYDNKRDRGTMSTTIEKKKEIIYYIALILFTFFVGYNTFGKGFDFDAYFGFSGDGYSLLAYVKGIQENGLRGSLFNERLGAPDVATLLDFPGVGNSTTIIIWVLSWFTESVTAVTYGYLLATFVLDGIGMSILLRKLQVNRKTAFVFSTLFAFAPYHFYRYLGHAALCEYAEIPLAIYLSLYIIGAIKQDKKWKIVVMTVLLGLGYGYYYAFGLILLAVAYIIKFIRLDEKKKIYKDLWVILLVLLTILASFIPRIAYSFMYGSNLEAGHRSWVEQEYYGLKIINLLLPVTYSRIEALRNLTATYMTTAPLVMENWMASLGIIGSIGFISLCVALIISFVSKKKCVGKEWEVIDYLSLSTLVLVLMGSIGGFGVIFNWVVTSQIRCYNRASIVITALAMTMVALLVNRLGKRWLSYAVCILVFCVGVYDQVSIYGTYWQDGIKPTQAMFEEYFSEVEKKLPEGAMVYQLPYMDYPESGSINNLPAYKPFTGYLFTEKLKWSYGGIRGRDVSAKKLNVDSGMSYAFLDGIKEAGFEAVYIDLDGYADGGEEILTFYNALGIEPMVSGDGKLYIYDISDVSISKNQVAPGFDLVKTWADENHVTISEDKLVKVAKGLAKGKKKTFSKIFKWYTNNPIVSEGTNEEYIAFIYDKILGRSASAEEIESWESELDGGKSRKDIFCTLIGSEEFRVSQGYDSAE